MREHVNSFAQRMPKSEEQMSKDVLNQLKSKQKQKDGAFEKEERLITGWNVVARNIEVRNLARPKKWKIKRLKSLTPYVSPSTTALVYEKHLRAFQDHIQL